MRKMLAVVLVLTCLLGVAGCSSMKVDKTKPVFETDNISSISFYTMPNHTSKNKCYHTLFAIAPKGIRVLHKKLKHI